MMDMGFIHSLRRIAKLLPSRRQKRSLSMRQGRPWRKALKIGHSRSG